MYHPAGKMRRVTFRGMAVIGVEMTSALAIS